MLVQNASFLHVSIFLILYLHHVETIHLTERAHSHSIVQDEELQDVLIYNSRTDHVMYAFGIEQFVLPETSHVFSYKFHGAFHFFTVICIAQQFTV